MTDEQTFKRARAPNYSEDEKSIIFHCILKEKNVIENKKTDAFSNKEKCAAWDRITEDFNSNLKVYKRDTKSLRRFWEIEKSKARKEFAKDRLSHMETGGGPEVKNYTCETPEVTEIILPSVDPEIIELKNPHDSDALVLSRQYNDHNKKKPNSSKSYSEIVFEENDVELLDQYLEPVANGASIVIIDTTKEPTKKTEETYGIKRPSKSSTKITINEEADLRVKKIKNAIKYEKNLYSLQIQHQKLLVEGEIAKRAEENH